MKTRWNYRWPGSVYANGPTMIKYGSERAVRAYLRELFQLTRLPQGFEVWRTNKSY